MKCMSTSSPGLRVIIAGNVRVFLTAQYVYLCVLIKDDQAIGGEGKVGS